MNIVSWNVLLRDYEEKYNPESKILTVWIDETQREDKIIDVISAHSNNDSIILLQEVSLSLLDKIKKIFEYKLLFTHKITENEYLVTLTPYFYNKEEWLQNEVSNGYLVVKNNNLRIINTHLIPQRYVKYNVLDYILKLSNHIDTIIAGDFNENWKKVNTILESRYRVPFFGNTYKKRPIDHIIFDKRLLYTYTTTNVLCEKISDHNLIKLSIV